LFGASTNGYHCNDGTGLTPSFCVRASPADESRQGGAEDGGGPANTAAKVKAAIKDKK
jgi:hypothetical protein